MPLNKLGLVFCFAVAWCLPLLGARPVWANNDRHGRCHQHRFGQFSEWSEPVNLGPVVNSEFREQHPAISADGLSLYITSDRPGGFGSFDLYVSQRDNVDDEWGQPQNLGPTINTSFEESVPTFSRDGHRMYFCSTRPGSPASKSGNIWVSFRDDTNDDFAWQPPSVLGSEVNTERGECGPTLFVDRDEGVTTLYFTRCFSPRCGFGDPDERWDIYTSTLQDDGTFGPAVPVPELNSGYRDTRSAIRNDGLEIFLTSSRPGGVGALDLWDSTRLSTLDPWSTPVNLGLSINTSFNEGAPALSCDGTTLYFYSNRPGGLGMNDLYFTHRHRLHHHDEGPEHQQ